MDDKNLKPFRFVSGMHRSGTTWVGEMIGHAQPGCVIHEPLNAHAGLVGVNEWYYGSDDATYAMSLLREMLRGKRTYRRRRRDDSVMKNLARTMSGSQYEKALSRALQSSPMLLLKDPFLIRLGAAMADTFDAKGIVMVRHPAALINSLSRMGWVLPNHGDFRIERSSQDPDLQFAFEVGRFWQILYGEVEAQLQQAPDHLMLVRHEDMCMTPVEIGREILTHLNLPPSDAALEFLRVSTSGKAGEISSKQLHNMHRDARKLAQSWRTSLSPDQIAALREGGGATLERIYPE